MRIDLIHESTPDLDVLDPQLVALLALFYQRPQWAQALVKPSAWSWDSTLRGLTGLLIESDVIEAKIDQALDDKNRSIAEALVRAQVVWSHATLGETLGEWDASAMLIAQADPEHLEDWIFETPHKDLRPVLESLRAAALTEDGVDVETLLAIREQLEEEDAHRDINQLDAVLATVDLSLFSRRVMLGQAQTQWMRQPREVADVLGVYGATTWLETLAVLEAAQAMTAFEFAALLAIGAAGAFELIDDDAQTLEAMDAIQRKDKSWDARALALRLSVPMALGDDDLAPLLAEVACHERLVASGFISPGVSGLPLSGFDVEPLHLEGALALFDEIVHADKPDDELIVRVVRTMMDCHKFVHLEDEPVQDFLNHEIWQQLANHHHAAINLGARQILQVLCPEPSPQDHSARALLEGLFGWTLEQSGALVLKHAQGTGMVSLLAILSLATVWGADEVALNLLGQTLLTCDVTRCDVARGAIETLLARLEVVSG